MNTTVVDKEEAVDISPDAVGLIVSRLRVGIREHDLCYDASDALMDLRSALTAAQRSEQVWRAEWEQITETAKQLRLSLTAAGSPAAIVELLRPMKDAERTLFLDVILAKYCHRCGSDSGFKCTCQRDD